jgi:RNA polymerase-binding transcription factor DksA
MDRETALRLLEAELQTAEQVAAAQQAMLAISADEIFDEVSSVDQHQADAGTETYEREKALTILQLAEERRADIEHALDKLAAGTFGRCETCGIAISDERLEARPDARFCQDHERDWELGRIGLTVSSLPTSPPEPNEPGWNELDLLPDDDLLTTEATLSPEEAALHVGRDHHRMLADETEAMEADAEAASADARRLAARDSADDDDAFEEMVDDENRWGAT